MKPILSLLLTLWLLWGPGKEPLPSEANFLVSYEARVKLTQHSTQTTLESLKLYVNPKGSVFLDRKMDLKNKVMRKSLSPEERVRQISLIGHTRFNFIIRKDYQQHHTRFIAEHLNREYNAYDKVSMDSEDWTLTPGSDSTLLGLSVHQAECNFGGRHWVAWFTPEIPVSDGPYKFTGLPGLILQLNSTDGDFSIRVSGIERNITAENLPIVPEYRLISESRFKEIHQMMIDNPLMQLHSKGGKIEGNITVDGKVLSQEEYSMLLREKQMEIITFEQIE